MDINSQDRVESLLRYLEDGDLRCWRFPDIKAFNIGISEWRSKLNCITNPHMYKQVYILMEYASHACTCALSHTHAEMMRLVA